LVFTEEELVVESKGEPPGALKKPKTAESALLLFTLSRILSVLMSKKIYNLAERKQ